MKTSVFGYVDKLNIYADFINSCKNKSYHGVKTYVHHIIPKYVMKKLYPNISKKEIDYNNTVMLSCDDHVTAHTLLSDCYEKETEHYIKNIWSVQILKKYKSLEDRNNIKKCRTKENNPFFNKKHTEQTKKYLSECTRQNKLGVSYLQLYKTKEKIKEQIEKRNKTKSISFSKNRNKFIKDNNIIFFENDSKIQINNVLYSSIKRATKILKWPKNKLYTIKKHFYATK